MNFIKIKKNNKEAVERMKNIVTWVKSKNGSFSNDSIARFVFLSIIHVNNN